MKPKTVEEKQRELVDEAAKASLRCFTAFREAHTWAMTVAALSEAETALLAEVKLKASKPGDIPGRRIANYPRIIPELFSGILPLDSMEAEAAAAREKMKKF